MWRLLVLLGLAGTVAVVGCTVGADETTADAPLRPAELGWLRAYSAWTIAVHDGELGPSGGPRLVEACRERLEKLGDAPSERLARAAKRAEDACPLLAHRGMHWRALDVIDDADELLLPLLRDDNRVPLESGPTQTSRADVDLSAWVARELERPAEVRCWDSSDWTRVVEEDNAWTDSQDDPEDLYGWAETSTDVVHLRLEQCNLLAEFRTDHTSGGREHEIDVADALGTLFHETEHLLDPDASEAEVECEVVYFFGFYAVRLGGDDARSRRLERLYRTEIYPEQPEEYLGDCE